MSRDLALRLIIATFVACGAIGAGKPSAVAQDAGPRSVKPLTLKDASDVNQRSATMNGSTLQLSNQPSGSAIQTREAMVAQLRLERALRKSRRREAILAAREAAGYQPLRAQWNATPMTSAYHAGNSISTVYVVPVYVR